MKSTISFFLLISAFLFFSCGQSAQQKAAIQQLHDDSIKVATENEIFQKLKDKEDSIRNAKNLNDSLTSFQNQYFRLQKMYINDDAQLTVLNNRLATDERFHFGRLPAVKEQQLRNDQINIDNLKLQMANIKSYMDQLAIKIKTYRNN
jgi:predicted RNase H-like nuclease (RuvC/YqgF family)